MFNVFVPQQFTFQVSTEQCHVKEQYNPVIYKNFSKIFATLFINDIGR